MRAGLAVGFLMVCSAGLTQTKLPPAPMPVMNEPYTAERTMTSYQKLADGTTIEHQSTAYMARDSQGRTWSKAKMPGDALRPETMDRYNITVYDPNMRTTVSWCTCSKTAMIRHFGEPLPAGTERVPPSEGMDVYLGPGPPSRMKYHLEELPPQVIMGVTTRGTKAVRTLPPGADGNDRELTTTVRSWYSPELRLALITIIDDPVNGLRKFEFSNLKRAEPDASLFQVPAGYTLKEAPAVASR